MKKFKKEFFQMCKSTNGLYLSDLHIENEKHTFCVHMRIVQWEEIMRLYSSLVGYELPKLETRVQIPAGANNMLI